MSIEDIITNCGVALNVSKSVFILQLRTRSISLLSDIRESAFSEATSASLANPKDILVGRILNCLRIFGLLCTQLEMILSFHVLYLEMSNVVKQDYEESRVTRNTQSHSTLVFDPVDVHESKNLTSLCELNECLIQCVVPPTSSSVSIPLA